MSQLKWRKIGLKLSGYGALWLMAATLLTKLIGVLQKIPLQNFAGDAVFGIYNIVYPIYQLMMALAIAGIPTALSTYMAGLSRKRREQSFRVAMMLSIAVAFILTILFYCSIPIIASFIGHDHVKPSLQVLALALLLTPMLAIYRGYYQGVDQAKYSSISQLIEQILRVSCMMIALWIGLTNQWSDMFIAAGVMWGSVVGALATLIWFAWGRQKRAGTLRLKPLKKTIVAYEAKKLLKLALPAALAAIVVPMVAVVDSLTIPRLVSGTGEQAKQVMILFGQYSRIQPLTQLVSMLLVAMVAGFLPRWVEQHQRAIGPFTLADRLLLMHRMTFIVGCAASLGLWLLSEPVNIMLYKDIAGITAFQLLCITTLVSSLLAVQAPLLQAAGLTSLPLSLLVLAATSKALLNYYLVPLHGINGAAIAAIIALCIPSCIGYVALYRTTKPMRSMKHSYGQVMKQICGIILALFMMFLSIQGILLCTNILFGETTARLVMTLVTITAVIIGAVVFVACLWLCKVITRKQLSMLTNK